MFSSSLECGINVCIVQLQDMHDMQGNVRQERKGTLVVLALEH